MGLLWFIGFVLIILYSAYNAASIDFICKEGYYKGRIDDHKVFKYCMSTLMVAIFWMIALPIIGVYKLGKRKK